MLRNDKKVSACYPGNTAGEIPTTDASHTPTQETQLKRRRLIEVGRYYRELVK